MRRQPMTGCGSTPCPKCGERSPCVDHSEVDIGVGLQTWDHEYECPTHGGFSFVDTPRNEQIAPFAPTTPTVVWRDES
jgi:hypothetical protein